MSVCLRSSVMLGRALERKVALLKSSKLQTVVGRGTLKVFRRSNAINTAKHTLTKTRFVSSVAPIAFNQANQSNGHIKPS